MSTVKPVVATFNQEKAFSVQLCRFIINSFTTAQHLYVAPTLPRSTPSLARLCLVHAVSIHPAASRARLPVSRQILNSVLRRQFQHWRYCVAEMWLKQVSISQCPRWSECETSPSISSVLRDIVSTSLRHNHGSLFPGLLGIQCGCGEHEVPSVKVATKFRGNWYNIRRMILLELKNLLYGHLNTLRPSECSQS